ILILFLLQDPFSWGDRLSSGSEAERWDAVEHLSKLGEEGAQEIERCSDPWWKGIALAEWEARRKAGKRYPEPIRVQLGVWSGEGARIAGDLAEKAGITLERRSLISGEITLKRKEGYWFEILKELGTKAELDIVEGVGGTYRIVPGNGGSSIRSLSRNYEVRLESFLRSTYTSFESPPSGQTSLQFSIRSDPRNQILSIKEPSLVRGLCSTGLEFKQVSLRTKSDLARNRYRDVALHSFEIGITPGVFPERKIGLIRGSVPVVLPLKSVLFEMTPRFDGDPIRMERDGITAVVEDLSYRTRRLSLTLSLRSSHSEVLFPGDDRIQVLDDAGFPYRSYKRSSRSKGNTERKYEITYLNVNNQGDPKKISFSVVTETYVRPVYFSFRDVLVE
ncbi:MAG: hypothetical protein QF645_10340, partial [Planctomycetota bacterium]|nr:hypothetical protein [Planctomycetota bacterium]